jgi:hypothetical protein
MTDLPPSYPLQWPASRPRRKSVLRRDGRFKRDTGKQAWRDFRPISIAEAMERLQMELERIGARYPVVSSNLVRRLDGLPRSGQAEPDDPGIAVYFLLAGKPHCMPCDTYKRVADNIAAIAAHIEATRAIERHGVASVAEMFAGFEALPSPDDVRPWRQVFELHREPKVTLAMVEERYRALARERHPDSGGSDSMMAELNRARAEARKELGNVG